MQYSVTFSNLPKVANDVINCAFVTQIVRDNGLKFYFPALHSRDIQTQSLHRWHFDAFIVITPDRKQLVTLYVDTAVEDVGPDAHVKFDCSW